MAYLIDKDALLAEIERRIDELCNYPATEPEQILSKSASLKPLMELRLFLDTLEVKEMDLKKIINDYFKDWKFDEELDIMVKPNNYSATFDDIKEVAKHFFELGMTVSNKVQKGEEV